MKGKKMNTITMICYKRPGYMKQALDALAKNDFTGYDGVHIFAEPVGSLEMYNLLHGYSLPVPIHIHHNPVRLGTDLNGFTALCYVFDQLGADFNVHIEEDVVVSPDALKMALNYAALPNKHSVMCLCLHNHGGAKPDGNNVRDLAYADGFSPYGWAATRYNWKHWLKPHWFSNRWAAEGGGYGWDWSVNYAVSKTHEACVMVPIVSRANTVGEFGGVNMSPEQWRKEFAGHVML